MTENEQKELRNYCAYMLKEYGFDFAPSDPVIPALYVIHQEILSNKKSNDAITTEIKLAAGRMNSQIYHFNSPGEGWRFQIAASLKWLFIGLSFDLLLWICLIWWNSFNNVEEARKVIQSAGRINSELLKSVQLDSDGFFFLEFKEAPGVSIKNFIEFERVNSKTVRVYLGQEK